MFLLKRRKEEKKKSRTSEALSSLDDDFTSARTQSLGSDAKELEAKLSYEGVLIPPVNGNFLVTRLDEELLHDTKRP